MKLIPTIVLAAALLSLIGCGSSSSSGMTVMPKMVTVEILDFSYNPKSIQINAGDTVRWVLVGANTTHTVTALNGAFDSDFILLQAGDFFDHTFTQANNNFTFEYSCDTHEGAPLDMKGSVLVGTGAPPPMTGY